jgi:hypothetical protein
MRQPGNEFKIDPFKAIGTVEMPAPILEGTFQKDHQHWQNNTSIARQHKFCAALCVNFKAGSGIGKEEQSCVETCFSKYGQAFNFLQQEKNHLVNNLNETVRLGGDIYASRSI